MEKRDSVKLEVFKLVHELNENKFDEIHKTTLNNLLSDSDTVKYGQYFRDHYSYRTTQWAMCHRKCVKRNTNMAVERWHKELKHNFDVAGRCQPRLDGFIHNLLNCLEVKVRSRVISLTRGKIPSKLKDLRRRHRASSDLCGDGIVELETGCKWVVPSTSNDDKEMVEMYEVVLVDPHCRCSIRCGDCNFCIHSFTCQCHDYCIQFHMCKHIHLICRLYLQNTQNNEFYI
jgi:hypothetical protein